MIRFHVVTPVTTLSPGRAGLNDKCHCPDGFRCVDSRHGVELRGMKRGRQETVRKPGATVARMTVRPLLMLTCAMAAYWAFGEANAVWVAGTLLATSAGCLSEWLLPSPVVLLPQGLLALATLIVPQWMFLLPAIAFDTGLVVNLDDPRPDSSTCRTPSRPERGGLSGRNQCPTLAWLAVESFWIIPASANLIRLDGTWQRYATLGLTTAIFARLVGFICASLSGTEQRLLDLGDLQRYTIRRMHSRIADLDKERAQTARTVQLTERTRIAREMHDNVGHQLTRAIMQTKADQVLAQSRGDQDSARAFGELGDTLDQAMTTIRRSVHDLEDRGTDFNARIEEASRSLDTGQSTAIQVHLQNDIEEAPAPVARCFATIIREALSNTARHSHAQSVSIILKDLPMVWQLVVQDDGAHHPVPADGQSGMGRPASYPGQTSQERDSGEQAWRGMGLADMEARAHSLGGSTLSGPNRDGWRVFVSLPKNLPLSA